jgi:hypothetical protein
MFIRVSLFLTCCYLLLHSFRVQAQSSLQSPEQFLGYKLGTRFTTHQQIVRYVEYLAAQAPTRMTVQKYGETYENRPLLLAAVSSAANMERLEEIRTNNLKNSGLAEGKASGPQPAIVWLSYNVHGNEAVSSEAVLQVLYELLDPGNPRPQKWLENTVVLVDPCVNPDGRERYVQWYNRVANQFPDASPYAREHFEPWPGGRPNHYLFDLNRDWAWQTQIESQHRIALYNQWLPQVHADFHEMGIHAPYYFSPAAKPFHEDITPWQRQFQNIIGDYNRKYFDRNNWLYFTREKYDLFYPSYGDTWPTFNGAIAMTYEQGGSGVAGLAYAKEEGDTLTLAQRIAHHHTASLATIEAISDRSEQVVQQFAKYYQKARTNPTGEYKSYIFKTTGQKGKLTALTEYLDRQQIRYGYAAKGKSLTGFSYATGKTERLKTEEDDLVISMYQPKSTLVKVLFEPSSKLEDSLTYDITSWALPYAFGLKAYAAKNRIEVAAVRPEQVEAQQAAQAASISEKPYAYLARWNGQQDLKFLTSLLNHKVKVRFAEREFAYEGQVFKPGTLIITRSGNESLREKFDSIVRAQADSTGITVFPAATGFVTSGADFGSSLVRSIKTPKVAVLAGRGVSPNSFGEVWHFFEQQIGFPVTVLDTDHLAEVPIRSFDALILPAGNYAKILDEKELDRVKDWIRAGGKLIALESAATFLADKKDFDLKTKSIDSAELKKAPTYKNLKAFGDRDRSDLHEAVQGSIYRVTLDATHPLAFGYDDTYFALLRNASNLQFLRKGWNVGVLKKDTYTAGFAGSEARKKMEDTFMFGVQEMGKGQVIYIADSPLFRGFWHNGKLLFGNAVFLVGQ